MDIKKWCARSTPIPMLTKNACRTIFKLPQFKYHLLLPKLVCTGSRQNKFNVFWHVVTGQSMTWLPSLSHYVTLQIFGFKGWCQRYFLQEILSGAGRETPSIGKRKKKNSNAIIHFIQPLGPANENRLIKRGSKRWEARCGHVSTSHVGPSVSAVIMPTKK